VDIQSIRIIFENNAGDISEFLSGNGEWSGENQSSVVKCHDDEIEERVMFLQFAHDVQSSKFLRQVIQILRWTFISVRWYHVSNIIWDSFWWAEQTFWGGGPHFEEMDWLLFASRAYPSIISRLRRQCDLWKWEKLCDLMIDVKLSKSNRLSCLFNRETTETPSICFVWSIFDQSGTIKWWMKISANSS
jgi:hypothetical protein